MSTRANIVISDGKNPDRILYHHHDGDQLGALLIDFVRHIVTGGKDDFAAFLKDYISPEIGYTHNEFEDAKVISTDIDYIYFVTIYPEHKYGKVVEGFKFPYGENDFDEVWPLFQHSADFTYSRILKYWKRSFYFTHGVPESVAPKHE